MGWKRGGGTVTFTLIGSHELEKCAIKADTDEPSKTLPRDRGILVQDTNFFLIDPRLRGTT